MAGKIKYPRPVTSRFFLLPALLLISSLVLPAVASEADSPDPSAEEHREVIEDWRQRRHLRLASEDGWLTLVGLEWLQEGENRVGKGEQNHVRLSSGPDYWGSVYLEPEGIRFVRASTDRVTVDGSLAEEVMMVADTDGEPTLVKSGKLSFYVIFRDPMLYASKTRRPRRAFSSGAWITMTYKETGELPGA